MLQQNKAIAFGWPGCASLRKTVSKSEERLIDMLRPVLARVPERGVREEMLYSIKMVFGT